MHADCGQPVTLETVCGLEAQHARLAGAWTLEIGSHFDVVVARGRHTSPCNAVKLSQPQAYWKGEGGQRAFDMCGSRVRTSVAAVRTDLAHGHRSLRERRCSCRLAKIGLIRVENGPSSVFTRSARVKTLKLGVSENRIWQEICEVQYTLPSSRRLD